MWFCLSLMGPLLAEPVLAAAPVVAASPAPLPAEAVSVWSELDRVQRLRARFEQVQHRSILAAPLVSTGTLEFARPARVRWEVDAPVRSVFVLDGTTIGTALPDLGHRESIDLGSNPDAARLIQGLMVWLGGDLEAVRRDYTVVWRSGPPRVVTLTPIDPTLTKLLASIELTIDGAPAEIRRVVLTEPSGDRVEIALSAIERDPVLPAGAFALP
ncbi:MAG: outer membrane lipoprotein carrier protein LolA [Myxococcota bacterium]